MTAEHTLVTMLLAIVAAVFVYAVTRIDVDCSKPWPQQITPRTYPWRGNIYLQCLMLSASGKHRTIFAVDHHR
jgi:hypothetical protein